MERRRHPRDDILGVEAPSPMESPASIPLSHEETLFVPSPIPSSRVGRSSSSQFFGDIAWVEEECRHPVVPNKKDCHRLEGKKSIRLPLILPTPGEVRHAMILGDGTKLCSWDFQVSPRVLETDSVSKPGIGACLIYSNILPRDE